MYVLTHWGICRYLRWRPLSPVLNLTWLCFVPVYVLIFFSLSHKVSIMAVDIKTLDGIAIFFNGLLLNVFFLVGYTVFFFLIERGLSLRVMIEIYRSPMGKMTIDEIRRVYTYDYILEKRLGQMLKMGYAVRKNGYLCSTERAARLIAINRLVRKIFRIKQVMP